MINSEMYGMHSLEANVFVTILLFFWKQKKQRCEGPHFKWYYVCVDCVAPVLMSFACGVSML